MTEVNASFDTGVLRVAYSGRNPNNTFISRETFEQCIDSIYNCPIVCNYIRDEDAIGGHDMEIKKTDGGMQLVHMTQPVGVIPESASYWWEEIEDSGGIHEYLCVDALIWKRQEAYSKLKEDEITDESMEITVKAGSMKDGVFVVEDFEFSAFCLLGLVKPCFESASLQLFSEDHFKIQYREMMEDFQLCFAEVPERLPKGGKKDLKGTTKDIYSLTGEQFRDELTAALSKETVETSWGTMKRYLYVDFDSEKHEVYAYDCEDWRLYGLLFVQENDSVVIDFNSRARKKFVIADFVEGDTDLNYEAAFSAVAESAAAHSAAKGNQEKAALEKKYDQELRELQAFQTETLEAQHAAQTKALFSRFRDLEGTEAFEALKENCKGVELSDLENQCYCLRGRNSELKFTAKTQTAPKLPVPKTYAPAGSPYGGLFEKYGKAGE